MRRALRSVVLALRSVILALMLPTAAVAQAGRAAMDEGVRLLGANQAEKAQKQFELAIKTEPGVGLYHLWLGRAVGTQAQNASIVRQPFLARRTKAEFEKAVALDPSLLDARDGLIIFYLQAPGFMGGSLEKAREQQRLIAERDPIRGHVAAASVAWHVKDTLATERALREAMAAQPDSVAPVIRLAQYQQLWRRVPAAFATYDGFLARHPADIAVRYQFARLGAVSGEQLPRAERILRDLLALPEWEPGNGRPARSVVHYRLGTVLEKAGRKDEARGSYEAALKLEPNFKLAKDALAALK